MQCWATDQQKPLLLAFFGHLAGEEGNESFAGCRQGRCREEEGEEGILRRQCVPPIVEPYLKRGQPLNKGQVVPSQEEDNLSTRDKGPIPNLSLVERLHCIRDKGPTPNLSLVERLHCIRDKGPVPNLSLVERLHCIWDKGPIPNLSLVERLHCIGTKDPSPTCPL